MIYELYYSHYESYDPVLYKAPDGIVHTEDEWKALVNSLLDQAVDNIIYKDQEDPSWLGWNNIVDEIGSILQEMGYVVVKPIAAGYFGSSIIDSAEDGKEDLSKESLQKLISHNDKVRERLNNVEED